MCNKYNTYGADFFAVLASVFVLLFLEIRVCRAGVGGADRLAGFAMSSLTLIHSCVHGLDSD